MLSERSREALDDLLVTWSWSSVPTPRAETTAERGESALLETIAREKSDDDGAEEVVTWLCEERNLPAAMAERIVTAYRQVAKQP